MLKMLRRYTWAKHVRYISSPVSSVRANHILDENKLAEFLAARQLVPPSAKLEVKQFSHGQSNPTYILSHDTTKLVLRKQPPGKLLRGAHAVDREYRVMTALKGSVPVPTTRVFCDDPAVIGTPFFCYNYVDGRFLKDPALPTITSTQDRGELYEAMLSLLAQLHTVDVDAIGLSDYGSRRGDSDSFLPYVLRQIKTWTKQYRATETEEIADMNRLIAELADCLPPHAEPKSCLVHGDFRMDNMLFQEKTNVVAALLDWELSTLGDPLSDLAYNLMVYHFEPDNAFLKGIRGVSHTGIPSLASALDTYCRHVDTLSKGTAQVPTMTDLEYYLAFSFFRVCAILQGVYKRSLQGNASAANASAALTYAKETARLGVQLLQEHKRSLSRGPVGSAFSASRPLFSRHYTPSIPASFEPLVSAKAKRLLLESSDFLATHLVPIEPEVMQYLVSSPDKWTTIHPALERLKAQAKAVHLWNLFLPVETDKGMFGAGLTTLEYAPIAELTGYVSPLAPEVFNCSAPDTGNMEVLARYGSGPQQQKWLFPLLEGSIRSCFAMTEPEVASSDATNMRATIERRGDKLILNGHKWWISGATDPRCKVCIFMGRTHGDLKDVPAHKRHSMVLVPMDSPGVRIIRPMTVMGYDDAPHGHAEMFFDNVEVPLDSFILGEGRGFEIAQGRLGPGRIHHCMRLIGMAEKALALFCERAVSRTAFGKLLSEQGTIRQDIAKSRVEINQARLLCLHAAHVMDTQGNKAARDDIAAIKIVAPAMAKRVIDRAMQAHGGMGLSQDTPLAYLWACARVLQLADGPDEVHLESIAKAELKKV